MSNNDDIRFESSSDEKSQRDEVFEEFYAADDSKFIIFWREYLSNNADTFGMSESNSTI